MKKLILFLLITLINLQCATAQKPKKDAAKEPDKKEEKKDWDVNDPPGDDWGWKAVNFTTDEGTWMNLDVSPDGQTIVFDMLGDIYSLPINGGTASALRTGIAWECQPRFSPDGSQVAVTYKQDNHWEVYTISLADRSRKRLTPVSILGDSFNSAAPAWSPDGSQIAFITDRSGPWEYWIMNADGSNPRPLLSAGVAEQLGELSYNGVDERLISWIE